MKILWGWYDGDIRWGVNRELVCWPLAQSDVLRHHCAQMQFFNWYRVIYLYSIIHICTGTFLLAQNISGTGKSCSPSNIFVVLCTLCWLLSFCLFPNWDIFNAELAGGQLLLMSSEEGVWLWNGGERSVAVQSCPWIMWSAEKLERAHRGKT